MGNDSSTEHDSDDQLLGFTPVEQRLDRSTRRTDLIGRLFLLLLVVALGAGAVVLLSAFSSMSQSTHAGPPPFKVLPLTPEPGTVIPAIPQAVPSLAARPTTTSSSAQPAETLDAWIQRVSSKTDIPARVLLAYANTDLALKTSRPSCHLTWATLAGIGRIESQHGTIGGAYVQPNGQESTPIIGPALDGSPGLLKVPAVDNGQLDGDPVWQHAVGPMQFTPETWHEWGVRASGDGKTPDPQNIDDAVLTAGRYLCVKGGNLADPKNWWAAVLTYNNSTVYGQTVFSNADAYARVSLGQTQ